MNAWLLSALLVSVALNLFLGIALLVSRAMVHWTMNTNDFLTRQNGTMMDLLIQARTAAKDDEDDEDDEIA